MNKNLKLLAIAALAGSATFSACSDDDLTPIAVTLNDSYTVDKCKVLTITPTVTGATSETYCWAIGDSVISEASTLEFISLKAGSFTVNLTVKDAVQSTVRPFTIKVNEASYRKCFTKLVEYSPTFGTSVNDFAGGATTADAALANVNKAVTEKGFKGYGLDLGFFGGAAVFAFDHTVANVPKKEDFCITMAGGFNNHAVVYIAYDRNKNGSPDNDEWYEIVGDLEGTAAIIPDYQVNLSGTRVDDEVLFMTSTNAWTDNKGNAGLYSYEYFPDAIYKVYPTWITGDMVLKGKRISTKSPAYDSKKGDKYLIGRGAGKNLSYLFDIDWARDKAGAKVVLPGIDFVKVVSAIFEPAPQSPELSGYEHTVLTSVTDSNLK